MNDQAPVNAKEFRKKIYLTWADFEEFIERAAEFCREKGVKSIYGIPRGGLPIAVRLSHRCRLPFVFDEKKIDEQTLICDDVVDSGETLQKYSGYSTLAWVMKKGSKVKPDFFYKLVDDDVWVVFPWEEKD